MNSAAEAFFNDNLFFDQLFKDDNINLHLEFEIVDENSELNLNIELNDKSIVNNKYFTGSHVINETVQVDHGKNRLSITITESKHTTFKLKKIIINNYDLIQDYELFRSQMNFINIDTAQTENVKDSFACNACYNLEFTSPFTTWYQENTTKNVVIAESMSFCATDQDLEYYQMAVDKVQKLIV